MLTQHKLRFRLEVVTRPTQLAGQAEVVRFAVSIDPPLRHYLERLARDQKLSIAEINRRVGERAESSGGRRPSYAAVRLLVRDARLHREDASWLDLYLRVAYAHESPEIFLDKKLGLLNKHLPEDYGLRGE